jgi:crotonobetainyl-CoA:carnitine CoA-transferase CaiB-like acyl-CoA transferase
MSGVIDGAHAILTDLLALAGLEGLPLDRLTITERDKVLATAWPIAPIATATLAAVGLAASHIQEMRTGEKLSVEVDTRSAEIAMASSSYLEVGGKNAKFRDPFTGLYEAADGEWVFLHGNFPHLRQGLLDLLGVDNDPDAIQAAVRKWDAAELEAEAISRNLCAAKVRERSAWEATQQAAAIRALPVLKVTRQAPAGPAAWPAGCGDAAQKPLSGLRMIDLSRVIAGPMAGRTFAEHGGTVLLVSGPGLPSIESLVIDTGFGKHACEIDLARDAGRADLTHLAGSADVVLDAYRPGAIAGRGLDRATLHQANSQLVYVSLSAFSHGGPWSFRRGYDSLVQATMGMTLEAGADRSTLLPCQPLDYLTGYLAAFGAMAALIRRAEAGGSFAVDLSLATTAQWMWDWRDRLGDDSSVPPSNPSSSDIADLIAMHETRFGTVRAVRPPLKIGGRSAEFRRPPVPLGSDPATWPA